MYHFVLVHGACHGAWCWFKLTDRLQNAGHKVTAVDLASCATRPRDPNSISTFSEYHQPLMDFLDSLPEAQLETPHAQKMEEGFVRRFEELKVSANESLPLDYAWHLCIWEPDCFICKFFLPQDKVESGEWISWTRFLLVTAEIVVVAHSMGGITLQQAMESFSHKINLAIFLAAITLPSGQALVELPLYDMIFQDTPLSHKVEFSFANGHDKQPTSFHFQASELGNSCYTGCASEDIVLASTLLRPFPARMLAGGISYTSEKHRQVPAVYIKCGKDFTLLPETQDFIVENYGPFTEVAEMETAGHSPFFEQVEDLSRIILQLADKYEKKSSSL